MNLLKLGMTVKTFIDTLNANFSELSGGVKYAVLYDGTANIPSNDSGESVTVTLTDDITQYDGVIIQREGAGAWQRLQPITVGSVFKVISPEADFEWMEGCNLYMCNVTVQTATQVKVNNNVYAGVRTTAAGRYLASFEDRPLQKIIGIKFS